MKLSSKELENRAFHYFWSNVRSLYREKCKIKNRMSDGEYLELWKKYFWPILAEIKQLIDKGKVNKMNLSEILFTYKEKMEDIVNKYYLTIV